MSDIRDRSKDKYTAKLRGRTKLGVLKVIYWGQRGSSKQRGHLLPVYSMEEFIHRWYNDVSFNTLYYNWVSNGYTKAWKPSFDRDDDTVHYYSLDCGSFVPWWLNLRKESIDSSKGKFLNSTAIVGICVNTGVKRHYCTMSEDSRATGTFIQNISKVCLKRRHTAGGFKWNYV